LLTDEHNKLADNEFQSTGPAKENAQVTTVTDVASKMLKRQPDRHQFNGLFSRKTWISRHQKG